METRHAKRRRKANDIAAPFYPDRRSYLDELPEDALINIVRFISEAPYHEYWQSCVRPRDALRVLQCGGGLATVARHSFDALHIHIRCTQMRGRVATGLQMERVGSLGLFYDLVAELGPRLRMLTMDVGGMRDAICSTQFEFCGKLRTLALGRLYDTSYLQQMLAARGSALRELHLGGDKRLPAFIIAHIATHCRALETLVLQHESYAAPMAPLWRAVGGTLRRLALVLPGANANYDVPHPPEGAGVIADHCTRLDSLELLERSKRATAPTLLCALGSRLRVLRMMDRGTCPTASELTSVMRDCNNADVYARIEHDVERTLHVLGAQLRGVYLRPDSAPTALLVDAAARCVNIEEAVLECRSGEFLQMFFATPKRKLKKLEITRCFVSDATASDAFQILTHGTGGLLEFSGKVECAVDDEVVATFLAANLKLQKIQLDHMLSVTRSQEARDWAECCAASMLAKLSQLEDLRKVNFQYQCRTLHSKMVTDACNQARLRNVDIIVGDVQYKGFSG